MKLNPVPALARAWAAMRTAPSDPQSGRGFRFLGPNDAGVRVGHDTAFMVAAVWACIDVVASALASSDWNVYSGVRGAADKETLPSDSLQYILNTRFNTEMTAQAGKRALGIAAAGYGNGYAEIERDLSGRIVSLWPISPDRVEPVRVGGRLVYRVAQNASGGTIDLDSSDVFHIRGASLTGVVGDDLIAKSIKTVAMAVAVDQFEAGYFANGTQVGGILSYPKQMDDPTYRRLEEQFNSKHKGSKNAFKTAILELGMTFTPMDSNAQKAQLIEAKYQIIEEVCRWFRVPPHKIAHLLRATNNNIEHQGLEFSRDTLRPWVKEIQQESDYKLIPARSRKFVELDVDWAEQGDYGSRMSAYSAARAMGVFSVNDVLRKLGENTIGPVGDVRTMNGAAVRLEDVGAKLVDGSTSPSDAGTDLLAEINAYGVAVRAGAITPQIDDEKHFRRKAALPPLKAPAAQDWADAPVRKPVTLLNEAEMTPPTTESAATEDGEQSDLVAAWLTSVYSRIDRRYQNRAADLQRAGHADWMEQARASTRAYAREQVQELAAVLGPREAAAHEWALEVVNGCEPRIAALAAMEIK